MPMRLFRFLSLLIIIGSFSHHSSAQVALNGIVHHQYYAGTQPELVSDVSSLPATGSPQIRHVWLANKHIMVITIDERSVIHANLRPYEIGRASCRERV